MLVFVGKLVTSELRIGLNKGGDWGGEWDGSCREVECRWGVVLGDG